MPTPSSGTTFRPDLGQAYQELDLMAQVQGYIGLQLAPRFPAGAEAGRFPNIPLEAMLAKVTLDDLRRGPDGAYARDNWEYGSIDFSTEEYGKEEPIDQRQARIMSRLGMMPEQIAANRATAALLRAIEASIESVVYDATTYSGQANNVTNEWDDESNATPIKDVVDAIHRFEERVGFEPNVMVMNKKQARNVLKTDEVQTVTGYRPTEGGRGEQLQGNLRAEMLAQILGVPRVLISGGFENANNQGLSASLSRIWNDEYVALLAVGDGQDLRSPSFLRTFTWTEDSPLGEQDVVLEQYFQPSIRSEVIRSRADLEIKVVHSEALEILGNITS